MVCINRRFRNMESGLIREYDSGSQIDHRDDLPTEYYEYDGSKFDLNDGLHLTQTRHYDATEGHWLSEDAIGYEPSDTMPRSATPAPHLSSNLASQSDTLSRYKALAGGSGNRVAVTDFGYDDTGRLNALSHDLATAGTPEIIYALGYVGAARLNEF